MTDCSLCHIVTEEYRCIKITDHTIAVICKDPIKNGHIMVLPKRHVTQNNYSALSTEEAHDLLTLIEDIQHLLTEKYDEDIMIFKNSNGHSSQPHFHMHLIPCKGNTRKMIAVYEDIPTHGTYTEVEYKAMKDYLLS